MTQTANFSLGKILKEILKKYFVSVFKDWAYSCTYADNSN